MQSIEQKYGNIVTLLQDGGIPLTAIREATKDIPTLEGKVSVLETYCKEKGIDAHSQYTALVENTVLNGKLTSVEISEAVAGINEPEKKLAALKKKLNIREVKPRIVRNNGGRAISESVSVNSEERVQAAMKKHKCSFREAHVMCGLPDPGRDVTEPVNAITDRAKRWRRYSPSISEADAMSMALKGVEPR